MPMTKTTFLLPAAMLAALTAVSCFRSEGSKGTGPIKEWDCEVDTASVADYIEQVGCRQDFVSLSSEPLSTTIPGATSMKSVIDMQDGGKLYFQNSKEFQIHWEFASAHLSGNGKPVVLPLSQFNLTEYYSPSRRFYLGAVTYYAGPKVWAYEIAPYDNASAEMIKFAYDKIKAAVYFGDSLYFHPTSGVVEAEAAKLPSSVKVITVLVSGSTFNVALQHGQLTSNNAGFAAMPSS